MLIVLISLIGTGIIILLVTVKNAKIEIIVCTAILIFGSIHAVLLLPNAVPDESLHISTIYRYSSALLDNDFNLGSFYSGRVEDMGFREYRLPNTPAQYAHFTNTFLRFAQHQEQITNAPIESTGIPMLYYIPATIGMTLGRLLRLSHTSVLYLARFCNFSIYILFVYLGLKKLSLYKGIFAVIALLPIVLQQVMSCSYDSIILSCSILFLAYMLELILGSAVFSKGSIVLLCIVGTILAFAKGGTYAPILLLCLLIPKQREHLPYRKNRIVFCVIGSAVALNFVVALKNMLPSVVSEIGVLGTPAIETNYTVSSLLQNPIEFIWLCIKTLLNIKDAIFLEMLGDKLASYHINISIICLCGFLLLLILSLLSRQDPPIAVTSVQKLLFIVIIAMVTSVCLGAAYLWTTLGATQLWGIQGRYFLPLWPLILLLFASPKITLTQNIDKPLVVAACALNSFVVLQLLASVA